MKLKRKHLALALLALSLMTAPAWAKKKTKARPAPKPAIEQAAAASEPTEQKDDAPPEPAPPEESKPEAANVKVLDLETAQRLALKDNPGMGAAQARIEQAKAKIAQAIAALQPNLDAGGIFGVDGNKDGDFTKNSQVGLQGSWLLFDGYARKFQQEQAEYGEKSSVAGKRDSQRLLVSAVADAFFNAQLLWSSIEIADADKEFYEQQLRDAQHRFDAGSGSWGDVLNIKVQLNTAQNASISARREFEAAQYGLAALLGFADSVLPNTLHLAKLDKNCELSDEHLSKDAGALIEEALKNRPDLKQTALQIKAAEAGVKQAEAQDSLKVQLDGQAGAASQSKLFPESDDLGATLSLSLRWNLYSGGAVEAAATEARQAKREAVYSRAELRNSIAAEVRQDMALLAAARKQVRLQQESVNLVEENRKLAKNEYEAGSASLVRLNEAQRDLTATHGRMAQAIVSWQQAKNRLLAAIGRNLEPFTDVLEGKGTAGGAAIED